MFDRVRIKEMAKAALRRRYWIVVLVVVIVGVLGGNLAGGMADGGANVNVNLPENSVNVNTDLPQGDAENDSQLPPWFDEGNGTVWDEYNDGQNPNNSYDITDGWADFAAGLGVALPILLGILVVVILIALISGTLLTIFVGNVMTVSGHGWLLRHWRGEDVAVGETFAGFRIYKPSVVTMLIRGIYIWLWSLLFIIPGIIMRYAYSMTPYIIYENPNLTANQAIKMSKTMTDGYKGDLFVLSLSFIGWKLLSLVTGGLVGIFWTNPYIGLTHAGVYEDLKWKAIQSGKLDWADFGQMPPPPEDPFEDAWSDPTAPQQPTWGTPAPQQPAWGNPAPQQPTWGNPAPQQSDAGNDPPDFRW